MSNSMSIDNRLRYFMGLLLFIEIGLSDINMYKFKKL